MGNGDGVGLPDQQVSGRARADVENGGGAEVVGSVAAAAWTVNPPFALIVPPVCVNEPTVSVARVLAVRSSYATPLMPVTVIVPPSMVIEPVAASYPT